MTSQLKSQVKKSKQHIEKFLPRDSVRIDDFNWFYHTAKGILLVHEVRDRDSWAYIRTDQIEIPWKKVEKALKNYDAANLFL